jgi:hypothetical protein
MRIQHKHIPGVLEFIEFEMSKGKQWLAIREQRQSIRGDDMQAFATRQHAVDFIKENTNRVWSYALVPSGSLYKIIDGLDKFLSSGEVRINDLHIELGQMLKNYDTVLSNNKKNDMIQENLKFLQENVRYMGFGDKLNDQIAKNMGQGLPEFVLKTDSLFNQKKIEGELHFRKSDKSDMYFFNSYAANLKDEAKGIDRSQTFYIENAKGVTFKEAFNLLEGRSVHKELTNKDGQAYNAWVQLDFDNKDKRNNYELKRYTDNYGFDLAQAVRAFPIKELEKENDQKILMNSLQKGNVQSVTVMKNGQAEKMFIEASPQWKTMNLYDGQMKPLSREQKQGYMLTRLEAPDIKQESKREVKQTTGKDDGPDKGQKKSFKNTQQETNGLLPKKRERSHKKGLSMT